MLNEIPTGAVEIQTGLYLLETPFTISGVEYVSRELYSADGYCFWGRTQPENYADGDAEGELLPLEQRVFAQYACLSKYYTTVDMINSDFISVPVQDGYEIVSVSGNDRKTV
jgi:hypothetical protein